MSRTTTVKATYQSTLLLQLALLLLALFYSLNVSAAESAGRLLFVRGEVEITSVDAEPRAAQRGDVLQVGDTIRTGTASNAQLRMSDGAMIALKADTIYRIEAQDYNAKAPGEGSQVGELVRGGLRAITGAIGHEKPEAVKYRTPVATIGIRGTVFDTIVIPPEGLPELPGMAPGTYVMVLEGQVLLSTPTGELLLGPGEVGYVPFVDAPPELRPDLSSIFVEFAAYHEELSPTRAGGQDGDSRTVINQRDRAAIYTLMADVSATQILATNGTGATVSAGPYGIANVFSGGSYQGDFFTDPVSVVGNGELNSAINGTGNMGSFAVSPFANGGATNIGPTTTAGDSTINWGQYMGTDVIVTDGVGTTIPLSTELLNYITATNVIVSTADLPTYGSYTYNYVDGASSYVSSPTNAVTSGSLTVDFGSAQMDISLSGGYGTYSASNQNIADFYGNGISLQDSYGGGSTISGRFVGSNAEGAIAGYSLNVGDGYATGVAVFAR